MPNFFKRGTTDLAAGGGGVTQVSVPSVSLGSRPASATAFTYTEATAVCLRGLLTRLVVTPDGAGKYDLEVRSGNGTGNAWLAAADVDGVYDISLPVYVEGDASRSLWIGIKNKSGSTRTYTLTTLRVEKFA